MSVAALLFFPSGSFVARAVNLNKETHMGSISFNVHRALQLLGFALVVGGVIIAFQVVDGCHFWTSSNSLLLLHGVLGFGIVAVLVLQVVLGLMRPGKDAAIRQQWAAVHKMLGHGLVGAMMINCVLGAIKLVREGVIWALILVAAGAILWQVAFILLQAKHGIGIREYLRGSRHVQPPAAEAGV